MNDLIMLRKWKKEQLHLAVKHSTSYRQVLKKLGLKPAGGNYTHISRLVAEQTLDTTHFLGRAWNKGLSGRLIPRIPLEDILVNPSSYQSHKLKKRLINAKLKRNECEECGWRRQTPQGRLPLELHHVNGDPRDNRLENLQVLCPNCHSLKPNHRARNIR